MGVAGASGSAFAGAAGERAENVGYISYRRTPSPEFATPPLRDKDADNYPPGAHAMPGPR